MPSEPYISVRGEATLEVEPEIALVSVTIVARDKDRHRAAELLAERARHVAALIKSHGDAVEKLESEPVRVHPEFKDAKARERIAGYMAQAGYTVTVRDFAILGELVLGLAAEEMTTVAGPGWRVRPDSPVHREVRVAAARDAIQRAREYAEAFGGRITALVEAADTGLMHGQEEGSLRFASGSGSWMTSGGGAPDANLPDFDFEPAKQTVHAQVEARFTMTSPAFGE